MNNDLTVKQMFEQIAEFQNRLAPDVTKCEEHEKIDRAKICSLALYQEVAELVDSFPWKPWREIEDQTMDIENMEREIIDCIFFLAQISRCFGITSTDLEDRFHKVLANNNARLINGYSKVKKKM